MVRLGASLISLIKSHSIISIPVWCDWEPLHSFYLFHLKSISIPVWCDWETNSHKRFMFLSRFQFQYGAIGSIAIVHFSAKFNISIPVWCDWECRNKYSVQTAFRFQFQYGAIGRMCDYHNQGDLIKFQFQYGAIGRTFAEDFTSNTVHFNSSMVRLGD